MKTCRTTCNLNTCFLCNHCLPEWLAAIDAHRINYTAKKGEQIFKEGDPANGIYFVYQGVVKVHKRWDQEKDLIIRFAKTGDMLGHLGLGAEPVFPVTATAMEAVTLCYLEMSFFDATLKTNTEFMYKLLRFFANELQKTEKRMRDLAHMSVKARIAQAFLSLQEQFGADEKGKIHLDITKQDISSYAGVSYETLFKVGQEFSRLNIIDFQGKSVSILNRDMLVKVVLEDNR